ncbi:MAG: DNA polymerase III subunit delta [Treponema sp.]|jgi:DNA polymerase-3 subunit delta|nr:DNA polymerase III subunit delta [Treponema sp.]
MAKGCSYLFLGPELGEKQDAVGELRENLRASGGTLEETTFYAGETAVSEMVSQLRNGSLFSDTRLFFIKNAELIKKKEDAELLASYLESPQADTFLVLISDGNSVDKRLEKPIPGGAKRIFWELFENRKHDWVASFFRREGRRVSEEGIEAILELVENNTDALRRECTRLMLFLGEGATASAEDVETWLSHTREESAFTLFSRIAAGDLSKSLETLHALLGAKEPPQAILAGLAWCFRKLRDYLGVVNSGNANDFEFKKIGLASTRVRKDYESAARLYGDPGRCLSLIARFDTLIRSSGSALESTLMDLFLYHIIRFPR